MSTPTPPNSDEGWADRVRFPPPPQQASAATAVLFASPPVTNTSHEERPMGRMRGYGDPPSPPRSNNPFQAHRGYGLHEEDPPSQRERAASPTSMQTPMPPFLHGSNRTWTSSLVNMPLQPTTTLTRSLLSGSNRTPHISSGINPFPPTGFQMPQNYRGQDIQNQGECYPLPTSPSTYQNREKIPSPSTSGQMTLTNRTRQPTPIPSMTQSTNEGTATPSMQEEATTSGPYSPTGTESSLVPTEQLPGNSGSRTLTPEEAGLTPPSHKYIWTGTSQSMEETNPWAGEIARGAFTTPGPQGSLQGSTRTKTDPWYRPQQATEFEAAYDLEPTLSRHAWSPTSELSSSSKSSDLNSFESFEFDEATFGTAIRDSGDDP